MITLILAALTAQAAPASAGEAAIPTLRIHEIRRCDPRSIDAAVSCISQSLDPDVVRDLARPAGAAYRPAYEALLTREWKLDDPTTPVAKDLARRGVYHPTDAARVLIYDNDARLGGRRFDYRALAKQIADRRQAAPATTAPAATAALPVGARPVAECRQPSDAADLVIQECTRDAAGQLSRKVLRPNAAAAARPAGALPEGIAPGSVEVALDLCKSSQPLPEGVVLKACFRQPDGRYARQAVRAAAAPKN